jgi:glucose-6-phosphate 1-dehydrogenase
MASENLPINQSPTIIIIFGVTGDLARRKVLPALYHLIKDGLLPEKTRIIGTSRKQINTDDLIKDVELCVTEEDKVCDPVALKKFYSFFEVIKLDPVELNSYQQLKQRLDEYDEQQGVCSNRLFYLSIPPQVFGPIVRLLGESGLGQSCNHGTAQSRLLVEKPFGYDLNSATELINDTAKYFKEEQIFRIDHYLAKETAQNILTFRKYNPLFNTVWHNRLISKINIRALEKLSIEGRVNFYDNVGALRDLIQSHLLQLLSLITMELPDDINNSDQIHLNKLKLFNSIVPPTVEQIDENVIRGQYASYRQEVANSRSNTETYVKLQLEINNQRWKNVPITLETGKALDSKQTDITIDFGESEREGNNQLTIHLQPNEGIGIGLYVKRPGLDNTIQVADMDFSYRATFDDHGHPDAYERVLVDAIKGDQSLFSSSDEVIRSWQILQPILDRWQQTDDLITYDVGILPPIVSKI